VTVAIQQLRFPSTFYASENVDEVMDWRAKHKVIWNFETGQVTIGGHFVKLVRKEKGGSRCRRCRAGSDVEIPPHSEAIISANLIL